MTTTQFATKIATAKSDATKSKYHVIAMDTLSKADYIAVVNMVSDIERANTSRVAGTFTDSMHS